MLVKKYRSCSILTVKTEKFILCNTHAQNQAYTGVILGL